MKLCVAARHELSPATCYTAMETCRKNYTLNWRGNAGVRVHNAYMWHLRHLNAARSYAFTCTPTLWHCGDLPGPYYSFAIQIAVSPAGATAVNLCMVLKHAFALTT